MASYRKRRHVPGNHAGFRIIEVVWTNIKRRRYLFQKEIFLALISLKEEEWRSLEHLTGILFSKSDNKSENRENS